MVFMAEQFCPVLFSEESDTADGFWTSGLLLGKKFSDYTVASPQTNIIYRNLYSEAFWVAWIGECSKIEATKKAFKDIDPAQYDCFCKAAEHIPDSPSDFILSREQNERIIFEKKKLFLLNKTKKEYVDLSKIQRLDSLDPLPFLTGAYIPSLFGNSMDLVDGHWAFDLITLVTARPQAKEIIISL